MGVSFVTKQSFQAKQDYKPIHDLMSNQNDMEAQEGHLDSRC